VTTPAAARSFVKQRFVKVLVGETWELAL